MKRASVVLVISLAVLAFAGIVIAAQMSGEVTAVDALKGTLTLKSGSLVSGFDCESGSMIKDVKVGDQVTVDYKEEGGKRIVTKVSPAKKKAPVGC